MAPFQVPSKLFSNFLFEITSSFIQINLKASYLLYRFLFFYLFLFYVAFTFKKALDKSNRQQKSSG